jgi:PAS domain S-box-containing protein
MTLRNLGLHTKLMLALALLVALVAIGSAHVVIEYERERRLLELDARAARIAEVFSRALAQPLWDRDRRTIESQIEARFPDPEVVEISVTAPHHGPVSVVAGARGPDPGSEIVQVRPIRYPASGGVSAPTIGEVRVVLTRAVAERTIAGARRAIVAITAGVVATLYAATYFLLKRLVGRPIDRLEEMVDRMAGGDLDARCPVTSGDELGRLAARVNAMADRLRESTARLRESERKYRGIFENALEGVFQLDRSGRILEANPALARLVGHVSPTELISAVDDPPGARLFTRAQTDALFETLGARGEIAGVELELTRRDGRPIWVQLNARGVGGAGGAAACLEGLLTDITARKQAETALHQTQTELARVTRVTTLGELAASIAHEINQPLAAIVADTTASINWLAADPPDLDSVREALAAVVKDGHRAADVIQRIRELARKTDPRAARLDVNDVVQDVLPLVRTEVLRHGVSLRTELATALPSVMGDRVQLQQVVLNLILNGIEAMSSVEDRFRELLIRSSRLESDQVVVAVQDSGVGIDPGSAEQLFDAFFTTKASGMGMGLSIARSIVEAHGGRLWATGNADHGATFQFTLPSVP